MLYDIFILIYLHTNYYKLLQAGEEFVPKSVTVVDGDSLRIDGVLSRISNLDTPERGGRAECDAEKFLAAVASSRAEELVRSGVIKIIPEGREDYFRRPLIRVRVNGRDWGEIMVSENLAVPWTGHTHDWCSKN